jgi:membrane protein DedA with SNARE-associated domain
MDLGPLLGLVALLFVKEAGLPIPIPGDLLVLGAGVAAAANGATAPAVLGAILVAGYLGGSLQFALVRGALRQPLLALAARVGVSRERLDRLAEWLRRRGSRGVAVARATPGLRIGAISASGLAALPFPVFLGGLVAGNTVFVGGHFLLGFLIGAPALALVASAGGLALGVVGLIVLSALGAAGWAWLKRRRSTRGPRAGGVSIAGLPSTGTWTEAACPACLAISLVGGDLGDTAAVSGSA